MRVYKDLSIYRSSGNSYSTHKNTRSSARIERRGGRGVQDSLNGHFDERKDHKVGVKVGKDH